MPAVSSATPAPPVRSSFRRGRLSAARVRVSRARQHIDELHAELTAFLNADCFRASIEQHPRTRRNIVETVLIRRVPKSISAIIGDAIHNARAALDMALAQLVKERLGYAPRHIRFPFQTSRKDLEAACGRGELAQLGPAATAAIVNNICPYAGGNEDLCALHELDILDRQFLVTPQVVIVELRNMEFQDYTGTVSFRLTSILDDFGHIQQPIVAAGGRLRMIRQGDPIFAVLFGKGLPVADRPVVPTLVQFTHSVAAAIEVLESAC